jgi:hypothetical protein
VFEENIATYTPFVVLAKSPRPIELVEPYWRNGHDDALRDLIGRWGMQHYRAANPIPGRLAYRDSSWSSLIDDLVLPPAPGKFRWAARGVFVSEAREWRKIPLAGFPPPSSSLQTHDAD